MLLWLIALIQGESVYGWNFDLSTDALITFNFICFAPTVPSLIKKNFSPISNINMNFFFLPLLHAILGKYCSNGEWQDGLTAWPIAHTPHTDESKEPSSARWLASR